MKRHTLAFFFFCAPLMAQANNIDLPAAVKPSSEKPVAVPRMDPHPPQAAAVSEFLAEELETGDAVPGRSAHEETNIKECSKRLAEEVERGDVVPY